jgi:hypothetical protein
MAATSMTAPVALETPQKASTPRADAKLLLPWNSLPPPAAYPADIIGSLEGAPK